MRETRILTFDEPRKRLFVLAEPRQVSMNVAPLRVVVALLFAAASPSCARRHRLAARIVEKAATVGGRQRRKNLLVLATAPICWTDERLTTA